MEIMTQLKQATAEWHDRTEALPLAVAIARGQITRPTYGRLLQALYALHEAYEPHLLRELPNPDLVRPDMVRAAVLADDLRAFGVPPDRNPGPWTGTWLVDLTTLAQAEPWAWLGALYVFEGSRLGSLHLGPALARGLGVPPRPGCGLDYHLAGAAERMVHWRQFKDQVNALPLLPSARAAMVAAAQRTFAAVYAVYDAIGATLLPTLPETTAERGAVPAAESALAAAHA